MFDNSRQSTVSASHRLEELMKLRLAAVVMTAMAIAPAVAFAQQDPVSRNVNRGAAEGQAVGGPVGGLVGGTVGLATGLAEGITDDVVGVVRVAPAQNVVIEEHVVVGEPLPPRVRLYPVPRYERYRYAVVNDERVIVDPRTRRVIRIIE
jgi:hypothetical protein